MPQLKEGGFMRLVSWNIRGGKHPSVVKSLLAHAPDVAVLVDCRANHVKRIIADAEKEGYEYHLNSPPNYTGILMISKYPLASGQIEQPDVPQRWLHAVSERFDLEIAAVYGPLPKTIGREPTMKEFWTWLVSACDLIVDRKAVICGDFNTGVNEADGPPEYRFAGANPFKDLEAHGWRDAYRELRLNGDDRSWWNKERGFRIDHCMLSRRLAVPRKIDYLRPLADTRTSRTTPSDGVMPAISDHAAMVIDF